MTTGIIIVVETAILGPSDRYQSFLNPNKSQILKSCMSNFCSVTGKAAVFLCTGKCMIGRCNSASPDSSCHT